MTSPSNRIKIYRRSAIPFRPQPIDPTHPGGYPCDRILVIPDPRNTGFVSLWDEGEDVRTIQPNGIAELWITNTNMLRISSPYANQSVSLIIERSV